MSSGDMRTTAKLAFVANASNLSSNDRDPLVSLERMMA